MSQFVCPTPAQVREARAWFEENEPRALFYRAATELVGLVLKGKTSLTLAEAVAVLLQTWNRAYYAYRPFDRQHFSDVESLLKDHNKAIRHFRDRNISSFGDTDIPAVKTVFSAFDGVLGPVGAAKSLHLLAPCFFPLWDREIARKYVGNLKLRGENTVLYLRLISIAKSQCLILSRTSEFLDCPLKALDEFNYFSITKKNS